MRFRYDNYIEQWAQMYKPISHDPTRGSRDKRFYRIDSITRLEDFAVNLSQAKSPSVAVVTQLDGAIDGASNKFMRYTHRLFFIVKQADTNIAKGIIDELSAADAKAEGQELAQDLFAWLYYDKCKNKNKDLAALDFETGAAFTVPQKFNGWWFTEVVIEHVVQRELCVNWEKYNVTKPTE